jgi:large subunit ribosomal protein L29
MKAKDLRERSLEDLVELEKSLAKDVFQNRLKNFTNRLDDTSTMKKSRRDLARVKTIIHQLKAKSAPAVAPKQSKAARKPAPVVKAPKAPAAPKAPKAELASAPAAAPSKPAAPKRKPAAPKSKPAVAKKTTKKSEAK